MKKKERALLLWFLSGLGWLGLHRFYLKKNKTAILWICSFGFFGIGAIVDLFTLSWLVNRFNMIENLKELKRELETTKSWKEQLVKEQRFEEAAYNRDKERILLKKIDKLRKSLEIRNKIDILPPAKTNPL